MKDCLKCGLPETNGIHTKSKVKADGSPVHKGGPLVFIHREDLEPLQDLLLANPREWNHRLRDDIKKALDFHKATK
ncbi:MAG TPA: hypothetical protein VGF75_02965 [Candidatus Saccharimonadales bacterium]